MSQELLIYFAMTRVAKQARPRGHLYAYSAQQQVRLLLGHSHLPTHKWPSVGAERVHQEHALHRSCLVFLFFCLCHGDWKLTCLLNNEAIFSRHFVNHPQAFLLDWNFSKRVLYMLSSSLRQSVCMVSLKIAIFQAKPCNCQRTSCVCVYNASPIVIFFFLFSHSNCLHCQDVTKQISREREKEETFPSHEGTIAPSGSHLGTIPHFMSSAQRPHIGFESVIWKTQMLCHV